MELCVLVAQHDPAVSKRIEEELGRALIRVAGPVADLDHALARPESQVVNVALVDVLLAEGSEAIGRFRARHPSLPLVATAPRRFEERARKSIVEGASLYLLHEEVGRGLLGPVLRHLASADTPAASETEPRRMMHDLGNLLAVASGESEMLLSRIAAGDPLADDVRGVNTAIAASIRLFHRFAASRVEAPRRGT